MKKIIFILMVLCVHSGLTEPNKILMPVHTIKEHKLLMQEEKTTTPKRISLNFQKIKIRAVLQMLADFTEKNMVISDSVQGDITLRLHDVPWNQALEIILSSHGLALVQRGNVLLIDTKKNLTLMRKTKLKNQHLIRQLEPICSDLVSVNYAKAADLALLIQDKNNALLSPKGKISVDVRSNALWIQDTKSKIQEIKSLIKKLDTPVKQVLIEARIIAVTKDISKDIGIKWGIARSSSRDVLETLPAIQKNRGSEAAKIMDKLSLDLVSSALNHTPAATIGVALAQISDNILLDLELSALESEGQAELISSPKIITVNQQAAVIDSGQEIPYQEATTSGATTVAFKKAVLSLKVIPQITSDNKILMDLQINQDTASSQTFSGAPAILTKEIQTKVLVNNAQTIVLGGIYTQDSNKSVNRIPFLGTLPLIGALFRNTQVTIRKDELLIFITTKIISATGEQMSSVNK